MGLKMDLKGTLTPSGVTLPPSFRKEILPHSFRNRTSSLSGHSFEFES